MYLTIYLSKINVFTVQDSAIKVSGLGFRVYNSRAQVDVSGRLFTRSEGRRGTSRVVI